eukprot:TRINITY_DN29497_c0_g1_i1.p1 TRINITY_DN29497_c0_g1~~TRINITY_DN29497_c0_g1_i1.p1  ORF type:complete len:124 (-),score=2.16 TRINITY_DN29497_c0_g1_i1:135-506(-)
MTVLRHFRHAYPLLLSTQNASHVLLGAIKPSKSVVPPQTKNFDWMKAETCPHLLLGISVSSFIMEGWLQILCSSIMYIMFWFGMLASLLRPPETAERLRSFIPQFLGPVKQSLQKYGDGWLLS